MKKIIWEQARRSGNSYVSLLATMTLIACLVLGSHSHLMAQTGGNGGFEENTVAGFVGGGGTETAAVNSSPTYVRSGSFSLGLTTTSTSTNKYWYTNNFYATSATGVYIHCIYWAKASAASTSSDASMRYLTALPLSGAGSSSNATGVALSTSAWTQVTYSLTSSSTRYYFPGPRRTTANATTFYLDDYVQYTSSSATTDILSPYAPTSITNSYSGGSALISWSSGGDNTSTGTTGVQATLVLKYTGSGTPTAPTLNNQAPYAVNDVPATDWLVVKIDGGASGSNVNVGSISANTTYALYHRDLAFNWSTGATTTVTAVVNAPDTQGNSIGFGDVSYTSITISWTRGNGENIAVFVGPSNSNPTDGIAYGANPTYGSGSALGSSYCVYNGTGTSVPVTGLSAATTYDVQAFEYNGSGSLIKYNVTAASGNPNSQATIATTAPSGITNGTISGITAIAASMGVNAISSDGGQAVTHKGVCWNTTGSPTTADPKTDDGTGTGSFTSSLTGLTASTTYYVRAYATNSVGTTYASSDVSFETSVAAPTITVGSISGFGNQTINTISSETSYSVSGAYLTDDIIITPPSGFEISTGTGGGFVATNPITLTQSGGTVSATTIYVRFHPTAVQGYSGNISNTSTLDAVTENVASSGTGLAVQPVTSFSASVGDAQNGITWANPTGTWTEVVVLAKSGSAVDQTPSGDGTSYTANAVFGSGTDLGSGSFVVYKGSGTTVTVTGLTNGTTYHYAAFTRNGSDWSASATSSALAVPYQVGDYGSVNPTNWNLTSTWKKWDGSDWNTSVATPPTASDNVWIRGGHIVTVEASPKDCKNLYVVDYSQVKTGVICTGTNTRYIRVAGTTVTVKNHGILGDTKTGDNADALSIGIYNANTTITGDGTGTINLNRIQTYVGNSTVTVDHDVTLNYHGSTQTGNASAYNTNTGDNNTLTVNAGKTLTFAPWAGYLIAGSSSAISTLSQTININGTLTFSPGVPDPDTNTTVNGWPGHNNYMSLATNGTFNVSIGATGTLNVTELYPNGTSLNSTPYYGAVVNFTIASGGILNVSTFADFMKSTQTVTGGGVVNIQSGAKLRIGSTDGIAASSANGNIQTGTRNFSSGASYEYAGSGAQTTGDGLPTTISKLTTNNAAGVTLSGDMTLTDTLFLTSGSFAIGSHILTLNNPIAGTPANLSAGNTSSIVIGGTVSGINIPSSVTALNNLTLNNSNGSTLQGPLAIEGALTLSSGNLSLGAHNLTMNGSVSGAAANTCMVTDGIGVVSKTLGDAASFTFPVAHAATFYNPVAVTNTSGGSAVYSARVLSGLTPLDNGVANATSGRTWELTGTGQADVAFTWNTADAGTTLSGNPSLGTAWKNNGAGEWWEFGGTTAVGTPNVTTAVGVTSFSRWTVGVSGGAPVTVVSVSARSTRATAQIVWTTLTEINSASFVIERRSVGTAKWIEAGSVAAAGNSNTKREYTFSDVNLAPGRYAYRINAFDKDGSHHYYGNMEVVVGLAPKALTLAEAYPNPFNPSTNIEFTVATSGPVRLEIYNTLGQKVATIFEGVAEEGRIYQAKFDAKSQPSGLYFARLDAGNGSIVRKLQLVK